MSKDSIKEISNMLLENDKRSSYKEEKFKANTFMEKMGFKDNELFEQKHDEMLYELMDEKVAKNILFQIIKINEIVKNGKNSKNLTTENESLIRSNISSKVKNIQFKPEFPIQSYNSYIIGFVDILIEFEMIDGRKIYFVLEIKTKIESIGALLRQLNTYRSNLDNFYQYIVIVPNSTEKQRNILKMSDVWLINIEDVIK